MFKVLHEVGMGAELFRTEDGMAAEAAVEENEHLGGGGESTS